MAIIQYVLKLYTYIIVYLAEEGAECKLADILVFFTGADAIPPLGFDETPELVFLDDPHSVLPTASTCDLQLRIPTAHGDNYEEFKQWMTIGILGFGVV